MSYPDRMFVHMSERNLLPPGLAELAPGPALAVLLGGVDRSRLNGHDLVTVMMARARQVAYEQAQLLSDIHQVVHCPPGDRNAPVVRLETVDEFAVFEVAAALTWTRRAAELQVSLAWSLVERLPGVHAALSAGAIDLPKARVLEEETCGLADLAARSVCARMLPAAAGLTTGQLRTRLRRLVVAEDPDAARVRQVRAVGERRVCAELDHDGTMSITALGLPAGRAAAAMERVRAIAAAARRAGDPRSVDQLAADTVLDLLDGSAPAAWPAPRRGVVELTVPMTTLIGLADEPGELRGWGPVVDDIARQVVTQQPQARWLFRVTDEQGRLVAHGTTQSPDDHRRPTRRRRTAPVDRCRSGGGRAAPRRPGTDVAEFVRARDITCRAPGCRRPASSCDVDHTVAVADGGTTHPANLGMLCRFHHRAKHEGGWRVRQREPGVFHWTSPLGRRYTVRPDPPPGSGPPRSAFDDGVR